MITDELWAGGPRFMHDNEAFRLGTDSVLLASFVMSGSGKRAGGRLTSACDLGCGAGILSILLAWNTPSLTVDGIELQGEWADIARENVRLSRFDSRINIVNGDLRRHRDFLQAGDYDLVVSNPPYYAEGRGKSPEQDSRAAAREERTCTLGDVCAAASYLTRWGGRFALVHKPERLVEVICALRHNGFEPKRLRLVHYRAASAPNLFLIEGRRGGNPSLKIEPPLILTDENGNDTEEVRRIYHRE
jgi:tRNA1Val (adenine37-N6)-methyltransferase